MYIQPSSWLDRVVVWRVYPTCGVACCALMVEALPVLYGLEVYSEFAAKHLWVEYGQASGFINLHLFPWRYW